MSDTEKTNKNIDALELRKFEDIARKWWDKNSEFKPLHDINPLRVGYITERVDLKGKRILDVGCGGGLLSEAMAAMGASVIGIDAGEGPISVAKLHRHESNIWVDYELTTIEAYAESNPEPFDVITCLEMLEHVPDPSSVINTCRKLLKDDGHLFLSTINRNPKAYLFAIVGAEYLMDLVPKGTHDYEKLIQPSEMAAWCRDADLNIINLRGMTYNPITQVYRMGSNVDVNYMAHARPGASS
ncbi:MAG: 2-polyprenyl-6-hydroxyphenyl methylase/3-demethylubiquinone-9 3-methyltransferase [Candidatus Azotimanducaceae bacterium]|jgi:2-polyprenyl-6-hydroxyphenyl methylase/3-demethylubiquinone-9 3-methyltransferase